MTLYRFHFDCGRMGSLDGMFAVDARGQALLDALIASRREVYFGEVLGKHSEVRGPIDPEDVQKIEATPDEVSTVCRVMCSAAAINPTERPWITIQGFNPLDTADESIEGWEWSEEHHEKLLRWCKGIRE